MSATIDGMVSGLSTSTLISSLMQVEAAPQNSLKSKVSTQQKAVTAYQSVNTKLAALESAAKAIGQLSTWRAVAPTSSSTSVTATAGSSNANATGTVTFDVTELARAQVSTARVPASGDITGGANHVLISVGGADPVDVDVTRDNSAAGVAAAINAKGIGVRATVVTTADNETVLQLTSAKTGASNGFSVVGGLDATLTEVTPPRNAVVQVGDPAAGGYTVASPTNSFTNLINGTTITASKLEAGVTVNVVTDTQAIADKMKALVDAANSALSTIKSQTASSTSTSATGATSVTGAALSGDYSIRQISDKVLGTVSTGLGVLAGYEADGRFGSLSKFGVELNRDGTLKFNADTFKKAYTDDPTKIKAAASAFATTVEKVADNQQTTVTNAVTSRTSYIKTLNAQISNWDIRLETRRAALQKQFAGLETSLSTMKQQSNWLAGQIASLG